MTVKQTVETLIETLYTAPEPSPRFVTALEAELLQREQNRPPKIDQVNKPIRWWQRLWDSNGRFTPRRLIFALLLIGILTAGLLTAPTALATVQRWLGYIPGIGFVDTAAARRLVEPVSQTQAGLTVTITDLIATEDETHLLVVVTELPENDRQLLDDPDQIEATLQLEDGTRLTANEMHLNPERSRFVFDALPADAAALTFILSQLPLANAPATSWEFLLRLDNTESSLADTLLMQYQLQGVQDTQQGITVQVNEVAHVAEQTAVSLSLSFDNDKYQLVYIEDLGGLSVIGTAAPTLTDGNDTVYNTVFNPNSSQMIAQRVEAEADTAVTPTEQAAKDIMISSAFAPIAADAEQLTLTVHGLTLDLIVDKAAPPLFTLNVGDDPQIGDHFPLDVALEIDGLSVQITGATIVPHQVNNASGELLVDEVALEFDVVPVVAENGRILHSFSLTADGFQSSTGGSSSDGSRRTGLTVPTVDQLPTGQIAFRLSEAKIGFLDEWQLSWTVPPR